MMFFSISISLRYFSKLIYRKITTVSSVYPTLPPLWLLCFLNLIWMRYLSKTPFCPKRTQNMKLTT